MIAMYTGMNNSTSWIPSVFNDDVNPGGNITSDGVFHISVMTEGVLTLDLVLLKRREKNLLSACQLKKLE